MNIDIRESRLRSMAHELQGQGISVSGGYASRSNVNVAGGAGERQEFLPQLNAADHHYIAAEQKNVLYLQDWQAEHAEDPAVTVSHNSTVSYS